VNAVDGLFYRIDCRATSSTRPATRSSRSTSATFDRPIRPPRSRRTSGRMRSTCTSGTTRRSPSGLIRAYQVKLAGKPGPWLAGMTLDPAAVSEAWCHQRGYISFIEELHQRPVKAGESFGAAYVVGWFDDVAEMQRVYDTMKGKTRIVVTKDGAELR